MEEKNKLSLAGQWFGYFSYGPEYGEKLAGERVIFSLLIENVFNNKFSGKCVELEGIGLSEEISTIHGFIENNFISFRKEYTTYFTIDESGNETKYDDLLHPRLSYNGQYDFSTESFFGKWELWGNERPAGEDTLVDIATGTWEISRESKKYGV